MWHFKQFALIKGKSLGWNFWHKRANTVKRLVGAVSLTLKSLYPQTPKITPHSLMPFSCLFPSQDVREYFVLHSHSSQVSSLSCCFLFILPSLVPWTRKMIEVGGKINHHWPPTHQNCGWINICKYQECSLCSCLNPKQLV